MSEKITYISADEILNVTYDTYKTPNNLTDVESEAIKLYTSYHRIYIKAFGENRIFSNLSGEYLKKAAVNARYVMEDMEKKLAMLENSPVLKTTISKVCRCNNINFDIRMRYADYDFKPLLIPCDYKTSEIKAIEQEFNSLSQTESYMLSLLSMDKFSNSNQLHTYKSTPKNKDKFNLTLIIALLIIVAALVAIAILA